MGIIKKIISCVFRKHKKYKISITNSGFWVCCVSEKDKDNDYVEWKDIVKIEAYKMDRITTDLLCIILYLQNNRTLTLNENMEGFYDLLESFKMHLVNYTDDWLGNVLQPPFEKCLTIIFDISKNHK